MIREATAMKLRQSLGELLNEVQYKHDSILITKAGKPVAAMVDVEIFDKIQAMRENFDRLCDDFSASFKDLPPGKGLALAEEASRWARKSRSKNK